MSDHRISPSQPLQRRLVVIGGGFAGVQLIQSLQHQGFAITLIDRRNHHLFQPLLYQVATSILAPSEIAWPLRTLFRDRPDVRTVLGEVTGIDRASRRVQLSDGQDIPFDTLVVATGARHAYFGHDDWETVAPGLKTLEDATSLRKRILVAFEKAEMATDPDEQRALLTFCIVGGGPTGVELAGTIAELARKLAPDFRAIDTRSAQIILVEANPRLLHVFPQSLSDYTRKALENLGVQVQTGVSVTACSAHDVTIGTTVVPCETLIWAAGVKASNAAGWLGVDCADRAGRVAVGPDLSLQDDADIFVIGDTAAVKSADGTPVPGIAPAAKQQGSYVALVLRARQAGQAAPGPFVYRHMGNLATIGPNSAVIDFGRLRMKGALAWWIWGIAHVYFLIGTRSRMSVAFSWLWTFLSGKQNVRLITRYRAPNSGSTKTQPETMH